MDDEIVVYARKLCSWCLRARLLLRRRGLRYRVVYVSSADKRAWLAEKTGRNTVPQIYFGARYIGGYEELRAELGE